MSPVRYGREASEQVLDELGVDYETSYGSSWAVGPCPLHDDTSPSFALNLDTGGWVCYAGCGSGDLALLVAEATGESVEAVRRRLLDNLPTDEASMWRVVTPDDEKPVRMYDPVLVYKHGVAPKYILNRGFTPATLKRWDVGKDEETGAVVLPVYQGGELLGLIRRNVVPSARKYDNTPGFEKSEILFGLDLVPETCYSVTLVEGPLDAMWLDQQGYPAVASLGATLSVVQAGILSRRFTRVTVAYDPDKAGRKGVRGAAYLLMSRGVDAWVATPPEGRDVQECNEEELRALYAAATPLALERSADDAERTNRRSGGRDSLRGSRS